MTRTDSLFFRALEPDEGWLGQKEATGASQRARMLDAITRAVADKGYARVTVGDVVSDAGVSRRTFYEQFKDKEDCFLAAYATGTEALIEDMVEASLAVGPDADWREVLQVAIDSYVGGLAADPAVRAHFPGGRAGSRAGRRRAAAAGLRPVRRSSTWSSLGARPSSSRRSARCPAVYLRALVGGIGELVQQHLLTKDAKTLPELAPVLVQLVTAVIQGAARPGASFALARK